MRDIAGMMVHHQTTAQNFAFSPKKPIGVFYSAAVADLLRMRLTVPLGYLRLQCESIALLKLMSENSSVTQQWVSIQTDKDGKAFFQKYQGGVMTILSA